MRTDRPQPTLRTMFQPVVALSDSADAEQAVIVGYEALTRQLRRDGQGWNPVELAVSAEAAQELDRACWP